MAVCLGEVHPPPPHTVAPLRLDSARLHDACTALVAQHQRRALDPPEHDAAHQLTLNPLAHGWHWVVEGQSRWTAGVGCLRRDPVRRFYTPATASSDDATLDDVTSFGGEDAAADEAAVLAEATTDGKLAPCIVHLSICHSPTYSVPVLWLEAHATSGAPLSLEELLSSTTFHANTVVPDARPSGPFLSQADHPATGRPSWFLHPCETEGMVDEVLRSDVGGGIEDAEEHERDVRWLASWLAVVGGVVDLRE